MGDNYGHGIPYGLVLVSHSRHGVYLKSSTKDVAKRSQHCKTEQRGTLHTRDMYRFAQRHQILHLQLISGLPVGFCRPQVLNIFVRIRKS